MFDTELRTRDLIARIVAFLTGVALVFLVAPVYEHFLGVYSPWLVHVDIATYGIVGVVFGLIWPDSGWRLGLYLFAIWPPMLLLGLFLGGEALMEGPVNWQGLLRDYFGYLMMGVAACIGAWLGSLVGRRFQKETRSVEVKPWTSF